MRADRCVGPSNNARAEISFFLFDWSFLVVTKTTLCSPLQEIILMVE